MSGKLMGAVYEFHIDRSERDVLLALADHAHDDGTHIFPAMDKLAWKLDISKRQVQRIMARLRERGVLIVVREASRYTPTHYRMDLSVYDAKMPLDVGDAVNAAFAAGVSDLSSLLPRGDVSRTAGVASSAARGDVQVSPEPSREPSGEPSANLERAREPVDQVWEHYVAELKALKPRSRPKLSDVERKIIREALKVRELEDVLAAVAGLFKSSWHTDGGYLGINYALRGGSRSPVPGATIDRMAAIARGEAKANGNGNGHVGILHSVVFQDGRTFDELTTGEQLGVKEMMAMGMKPWEDEQPAPAPRTVSNGRTYTGDNICD